MRSLLTRALVLRAALFVLIPAAAHSIVPAQAVPKQETGTVTGRVTVGDKPFPNVVVALYPVDYFRDRKIVAKSSTDYDGRYRLTNVPAGRYTISALAPAFVGPTEGIYGDAGKTVTIAEGETVEKIDFALVRGGVITGRVTSADGSPVIEESIQLNQTDKQARQRGFLGFNPFMYQTDDRGIYRLYGVPPGRYTISVGQSSEEGVVNFGAGGRGYFTRTFYPGVTEEAKATIIEISEGTEATNIDITLAAKAKSFAATGQVTDESGQPVVNARIGNGSLLKNDNRMGAFGWGTVTDAAGRFRLDGLMPGRYAAFVWTEGETEGYSEPVQFEITDANISGLELKLRRGTSISGVVVMEGTTDKAALAKLSQLMIGVATEAEGALVAPYVSNNKIAPDGSFRITGLRPGKARLYLAGYPPPQGFTLARVERDGVAQPVIEVGAGQPVTNVRVVVEYGSGSVRGVVKVENGPLPEGTRMYVSARRPGSNSVYAQRGTQVDSRGRFLIEGLPTGEYELALQTFVQGKPRTLKQNVSVTNGAEAEVTITLDLSAKQPEGGNND